MKFTIQQLRSYPQNPLTFLEFLSLESDELFVSARAFSRLNTSSSTESTFWAICILHVSPLPGLQSTVGILLWWSIVSNWWRGPVSVQKLVDKLLNFSLHNLSFDAKHYYHFSFFAKTIVYYRLHSSDMSMTSIADTRDVLYWYLKNDTSSKFDFFTYGSYF